MRHLVFILLFSPAITIGQCIEGDCQNGPGQYKLKGGTYTGDFAEGNIHGRGSYITKRGYSYTGNWIKGAKEGFGKESFRKGSSYEGDFANNYRNGYGKSGLPDTKFMKDRYYEGQWFQGSICGKGELTYSREVKYGREKIIEENRLIGDFINGVFQGRQTSAYSDELKWDAFKLKMSDFQKYQNLTPKARKKLKNPATLEGDFLLSCECLEEVLVYDITAIFRKSQSWWSTVDIPPKTKPIILNTMQKEFDIIEWHARALQLKLNKQKMPCTAESISSAWQEMDVAQRECLQLRRQYSTETAWNPKKGSIKNIKVQEKWNSKISKKLQSYEKSNKKIIEKLNKKFSKKSKLPCNTVALDNSTIPIIPKPEIIKEEIEEEIVVEREPGYLSQIMNDWKEGHASQRNRAKAPKEEKKPREPRSFKPQFPRSKQLQ